MKQIVTIRLGHYVLKADDDAAEHIQFYTELLRKKYSTEEGGFEIINDIEERIGELLQQKQIKQQRSFTTLEDAKEATGQMGHIDDTSNPVNESNAETQRKRLFRDPDNKILGGVLSGLSAYFNIDPTIVRLIWVLSVLTFGFGVPLYIILWVIVPEANSMSEKMMMHGKTPTLKNIEENVKRELNDVGQRLQEPGTTDKISSLLRNLIFYAAKFFATIFRTVFAGFALLLLAVLIAVLIAFATNNIHFGGNELVINGRAGIDALLSSAGNPLNIHLLVLGFILTAIAYSVLKSLSLGRKKLVNKLAMNYLGWSMFVMLLSMVVIIAMNARNFRYRNELIAFHEELNVSGDTLYLKSAGENIDAPGLYALHSFADIRTSDDNKFRIEQSNISYGRSYISSYAHSGQTNKLYNMAGNVLTLSENSRLQSLKHQGAGWVKYVLYVPKGKHVKTQSDFSFTINNYTELAGPGQSASPDSSGLVRTNGSAAQKMNISTIIENVSIHGKFQVQIIQDNKSYVELISGPVTMNQEMVNISGNTITLEQADNFDYMKPSVVRIHLSEVRSISASGASSVYIKNWDGGTLDLQANGASHITGNTNLQFSRMDINGASDIKLNGSLKRLELILDGASAYYGENLKCDEIELNMDGAATAIVWAQSKITGKADGACVVKTKGNPLQSNIKSSGAVTFEKY